jgi:hypothetical protein
VANGTRLLAFAFLLSMTTTAAATSILGSTISGSYDYPCVGCTDVGGFLYTSNPFIVSDPAVETSLQIGSNSLFYSQWDVNFGANSVTLTMVPAPFTSVSYTGAPFNGPVFTVLSGNSFGSVTGIHEDNPTCVPCTPMTAFVLGDGLYINWQGAGGSVGATVEIDFTGGEPINAVPAPPTLLLFATGLGLMTLLAWRRRRPIGVGGK